MMQGLGPSQVRGCVAQVTPVFNAPAAPTEEPHTKPEKPSVEPEQEPERRESQPPPQFEPRVDPDSDPAPVCPEGDPDEGDGEFQTCRLRP